MISISISPQYGYVLFAALTLTLEYTFIGFIYGGGSRKVFN